MNPTTGERFNDVLISMKTPGAAGALIASAGDLVRWQIALVNGRAVSPESYRKMITSAAETGDGSSRYGFGLGIAEIGGQKRISHAGGIPGFNSVLTYLPEEELHVAVISNSQALPSQEIGDEILAAITSAEPPAPPRTTAQPGSAAAVRRMIGEIARGEPDYDLLSPGLAAATREQLPGMQPMFQALGEIESVTFVSVGLDGTDVYDVQLENGSLVFRIILDEEGRTVTAWVAPGSPRAKR